MFNRAERLPVIWMEITGIKCDNPACGYHENTVPFTNFSDYINKPCPDCGANLLTEKDALSIIRYHEAVNFVNKWFW
jgi:hypothetical protein